MDNAKQLVALADEQYNRGSFGAARANYLEAIEALEKRNADLEDEKAKLSWCYEQSEKELRTIAAMVCGTRGNVLQDVKNLVAPSPPAEQGPKENSNG